MTREEIIHMAQKAGAKPGFDNEADIEFLTRFAALASSTTPTWHPITPEEITPLTHRDIPPWVWHLIGGVERILRQKNSFD